LGLRDLKAGEGMENSRGQNVKHFSENEKYFITQANITFFEEQYFMAHNKNY